jgi:hypothetical protein
MATHATVGSRAHANVPSPLGAAAPLVALAVFALALDLAPELPWEAGLTVSSLFLAAATVRFLQKWIAVRRLRAIADRIILRNGDRPTASPLVAWRTVELTSRRHRLAVAAEAARLARELDASTLPGAVPLNRSAVRPYRQELEALAAALDGDQPTSARGILLAERFLSSPASPLYDRFGADTLGPRLHRVISTLQGSR